MESYRISADEYETTMKMARISGGNAVPTGLVELFQELHGHRDRSNTLKQVCRVCELLGSKLSPKGRELPDEGDDRFIIVGDGDLRAGRDGAGDHRIAV